MSVDGFASLAAFYRAIYAVAHVALCQVVVRAQLRRLGFNDGSPKVLRALVVSPTRSLSALCVGPMAMKEQQAICVTVWGVASLDVDYMLPLGVTSAIRVVH